MWSLVKVRYSFQLISLSCGVYADLLNYTGKFSGGEGDLINYACAPRRVILSGYFGRDRMKPPKVPLTQSAFPEYSKSQTELVQG